LVIAAPRLTPAGFRNAMSLMISPPLEIARVYTTAAAE
jgi:hypothetical protein